MPEQAPTNLGREAFGVADRDINQLCSHWGFLSQRVFAS